MCKATGTRSFSAGNRILCQVAEAQVLRMAKSDNPSQLLSDAMDFVREMAPQNATRRGLAALIIRDYGVT
jgi:hypothetical protein